MKKKLTFLKLFRLYIEYNRNPIIFDDQKSEHTLKIYTVRYNNVTAFLATLNLLDLPAEEFSIIHANKLVTWSKKQHSHNYAVRIAEMCESVMAYGYKNGFVRFNHLHTMNFKKQKPAPPVYLTPDEVADLENYRGPKQHIANLFLFQCYTGLDFGDLMTVRRSHIVSNPGDKREYIIKQRVKTKVEALIPLFAKTRDLWAAYNFDLPKISNQKYNDYIKEVCASVGITKRITSHVGRKTAAMIKLNYEGYSMEAVSKILGHSTVKTTELHYAKVNLKLVSKELDRLGIK